MRHLLELLLKLFPREFRDRFEGDMREQITTDLEVARSKGGAAALGFIVTTSFDLLRGAAAERWSPTWVRQGSRVTRTGGGGDDDRTLAGRSAPSSARSP